MEYLRPSQSVVELQCLLWLISPIRERQSLSVADQSNTRAAESVCGWSVQYESGRVCLWLISPIRERQSLSVADQSNTRVAESVCGWSVQYESGRVCLWLNCSACGWSVQYESGRVCRSGYRWRLWLLLWALTLLSAVNSIVHYIFSMNMCTGASQ